MDPAGGSARTATTTWSTASWETIHLHQTGHRLEAVVYTVGSLVLCLAAAAAGLGLAGLA
jgi:fluoride ion exporter CrcB/FEX